jgi:hypothetical protein
VLKVIGIGRARFSPLKRYAQPAIGESPDSSHEAPATPSHRGFGLIRYGACAVEDDLIFCRRQALNLARRAVYSRDQKTRRRLATMAHGWAELARAVESIEPISAEFRLAGEIGWSACERPQRNRTKRGRRGDEHLLWAVGPKPYLVRS